MKLNVVKHFVLNPLWKKKKKKVLGKTESDLQPMSYPSQPRLTEAD